MTPARSRPPRRRYAEKPALDEQGRRRLRDVDSANRAFHLKAAAWAGGAGVVGYVAGSPFGDLWGILGFLAGWGISYGVTVGLMYGAGRTAGTVYAPSGKTTPGAREYSEAQARVAQGHYVEAAALYEAYAAEFPEDPTPYIALARIQREHLGDPEAAAAWFRRARRDARLDTGQQLLVAQELIELYTTRLHQPQRAIPELARIPQLLPGSPQAAAAEREIAALRAAMRNDRGDPG